MSGGYDVAFVALHGRYGEDGSIQGLLDILHIPYTFSGVAASAAAAEKQIAKAVFKEAEIPVPDGVDIPAGAVLSDACLDSLVERLGLPLFVKPGGQRIELRHLARDRAGAAQRCHRPAPAAPGDACLVESCVEGTEITVPVLGNDDAHALPIVEIGDRRGVLRPQGQVRAVRDAPRHPRAPGARRLCPAPRSWPSAPTAPWGAAGAPAATSSSAPTGPRSS